MVRRAAHISSHLQCGKRADDAAVVDSVMNSFAVTYGQYEECIVSISASVEQKSTHGKSNRDITGLMGSAMAETSSSASPSAQTRIGSREHRRGSSTEGYDEDLLWQRFAIDTDLYSLVRALETAHPLARRSEVCSEDGLLFVYRLA